MKRKLSFLLMSFLAFGAFSAVQATKNDNALVAKAEEKSLVATKANIDGAGISIYFADLPAGVSVSDFKVEVTKWNGGGTLSVNTMPEFIPSEGKLLIVLSAAVDNPAYEFTLLIKCTYGGDTYSGEFTFKNKALLMFTAPTNAYIEDGKLYFTPGSGADSHSVQYLQDDRVVATENNVVSGHVLKDDLEPGDYNVQVRSHMGEAVSEWVYAGRHSVVSADAEQLDAPTNVHVKDGYLTFEGVDNAISYNVKYSNDGTSEILEEKTQDTTYKLNDKLAAGVYTISVCAVGDNKAWTDSNYVEAEEKFEIESSVIMVKFNLRTYYGPGYATVGLKWDGDVSLKDETAYYTVNGKESRFFDWFAIENNRAGNFQIFDDGSQAYYEFCFYNAARELIANGALINSVPAPTKVQINSVEGSDEKTLTFDSFKYADRYSLQYLKAADDSLVDTEYSVESGYVLKDLEPGSYKVQIRAHLEGYADSEWVEADKIYEVAAEGAEQLNMPTNVKVEDGKLYFDLVDNATKYSIEYYKDGSLATTEIASESPYTLNSGLEAGEYTIKISAMNDDPNFTQSEYVEADGTFVVEFVPVELKITLRTYYGPGYATIEFQWDDPKFSLYDEVKEGYYTVNGRESRFFAWFGGEGNKAGNFEIGDDGSQASYEFLFYNAAGVLVARGVLVNEVADTVGQFIADWHKMREDGGDNGICAFLTDSENATLKALLDRFMAFSPEEQETIRLAADVDTITIGQTMDYMSSMQSWVSDTLGVSESGLNGILLASSAETTSLVTLFVVLGFVAVSAYYFIEKKKLAK